MIILANIIVMVDSLNSLGQTTYQSDQMTIGRSYGFTAIMYWTALLKYLTYDPKISNLPNTMIGSARNVTEGIIGLMPIFMGFSTIAFVTMNIDFRFRSTSVALFTLFYNCNGDTLFDTLYAANTWNPLMTFIWAYAAVQFTLFVFLKLSLAMIEEGYIFYRTKRQFDWIMKPDMIENPISDFSNM